MGLLLVLVIGFVLGFARPAHALELGVQDQGADPATLVDVAGQLHARTARIIARPGEPHLQLVRAYRRAGLHVQAAVLLKPTHTAGDVRALMRAWDGQVRTVSVGNEPELNGFTPCGYARLYRRAYALIRREFPGTRVGVAEFSPNGWSFLHAMLRCRGPRLRASYLAVHAYQFWSDPLAMPSAERVAGGSMWLGLGSLHRLHRALRAKATRRALSTPAGRALPIEVTEFAYLVSGQYAVSPEKAAWLWPRALKQARKWARSLVIYGLGPVHDRSSWGSASLLDRYGRRTPAFEAIARALGVTLRPELPEPPAPAGDLIAPVLPDGEPRREHPPLAAAASAQPAEVLEDEATAPESDDPGGQSDDDAPETAPALEPPAGPAGGSEPAPDPTEEATA